mmetsp:Transcript_10572/g.20390  ORF Transcript_10572/g.20390 Transcript_10572/m.20390 type:complete len:327 (+) Transcript_10572:80-1060(+)
MHSHIFSAVCILALSARSGAIRQDVTKVHELDSSNDAKGRFPGNEAPMVELGVQELPTYHDAVAGASYASTEEPLQHPRGPALQVPVSAPPVYVMDPRLVTSILLEVVAPTWCWPCNSEPMEIAVARTRLYITTPNSIFAGQTFFVVVPEPLEPRRHDVTPQWHAPDVVLESVLVSDPASAVKKVLVQVPQTHGPGMPVKVKVPDGDIREMVLPVGAFYPYSFTFRYNPTAEAEEEMMKNLEMNYRCCFQDFDGRYLWYPKSVLKVRITNKELHCPRRQERIELPACAKDSCGLLVADKGCTKTHHRPGMCIYSMDKEHHFEGDSC